jgi:drug/metabolite transporter (DMT)-like permease
MKHQLLVFATAGAVLAAFGQVCFKSGAAGRSGALEFVNVWIVTGMVLYLAGTLLWIRALSGAPLTVVYPFSALTFVLVNLLAVALLGERLSPRGSAGTALVLAGLFLLATSHQPR